MADLIYFDEGHIYMLEGERIPCVSDLCRFIHREIYSDVPVWQMEAAAERGTAVHKATEALDKAGRAEIADEYLPYLQAYAAFLKDHKVYWDMVEQPLYHPEERYAGTIDRYGSVDGIETLVDVKTTYTVYKPLCSAQLNLYRRMLEAKRIHPKRLAILHLKKDGSYRFMKFEFDDLVPTALIALHNTLKKKRGRKNGRHSNSG